MFQSPWVLSCLLLLKMFLMSFSNWDKWKVIQILKRIKLFDFETRCPSIELRAVLFVVLATIENCPTSEKSLRLPSNSDTVNVTLDDVIFATTYGKSCSGQKLKLDFTDNSIKYRPYLQTVTVSASDKHGTATCKISVNVIGKVTMVIY